MAQVETGGSAAPPPVTRWSEHDRVTALEAYRILDTPTHPDFDDIALLAAAVFEAPIAVVNLIATDRQWFKAEVGIGVRELPLDVSICRHAILQDDFLVIPDTRLDPRVECNPLVTADDGLRFYAGALLRTPAGLPIGTLCVIDRAPRPDGITPLQRLALEVLARQVMTQLELQLALRAAKAAEQHRQLLTEELQHRVKNTMAVMQSIVSQSLRSVATPAEARDAIGRRLITLANAHDVLAQTSWTAAPIWAIASGATAVHGGQPSRIRLDGPALDLSARAALALAMTLHELTTNAVKYGALSNDGGNVELAWTISDTMLAMSWHESGGPAVVAPTRLGFGSRLMAALSSDLGSAGALDYHPDGVTWTLKTPLASVIS